MCRETFFRDFNSTGKLHNVIHRKICRDPYLYAGRYIRVLFCAEFSTLPIEVCSIRGTSDLLISCVAVFLCMPHGYKGAR